LIQELNSLLTQEITAQNVLNWLLPAIGIVAAIALLIYLWRYMRKANHVGRISEFNEREFKKLIKEGKKPGFCEDCKIPMRVEIHYRDFLKDTGDFLIHRETAAHTLKSFVDCERMSQEDADLILLFFDSQPKIQQQLFKRYKCPNCNKMKILPYLQQSD